MKKLIAVALSVLSLSAVAQARTPMPVLSSNITRVEIQGMPNAQRDGILTINEIRQTVTLVVEEGRCPRGAMCLVGPRVIIEAEMNIVARDHDRDGTEIIRAMVDRRPVDGALQQIEIRDNRFSRSVALQTAPLQARFTMVAPQRRPGMNFQPFRAYLEGTALQMYPFSRR